MDEYRVRFVRSGASEFSSLPPDVKGRVGAAVDSLVSVPRPPGVRKLRGHQRLYRIRVGHYRIVYEIHDDQRLILVTRVRHRRDAYA